MKTKVLSILIIVAICLSVSGCKVFGAEKGNPFYGSWILKSIMMNGKHIPAHYLLECDSVSAEVDENGLLTLLFSNGNKVSITPSYNKDKLTVHYTAFNHDMIWNVELTDDNTVTATYDVYSMVMQRTSESRYYAPEKAPKLTGDEDQILEPLSDLRLSSEFGALDAGERAEAIRNLLIQAANDGDTCLSGAEIDTESIFSDGEAVWFYDFYGIEYRVPLYEQDPDAAGSGASTVSNAPHQVLSSGTNPSDTDAAKADVLVLYGFSDPDETDANYVGYRSVAENLDSQGITTEFIDQATVEDFKHLEGHKIVWICEHGQCTSAPWFEVNEEADTINFIKYYKDLTTIPAVFAATTNLYYAMQIQSHLLEGNRIFVNMGILHSKYAIKPKFFEYYYGDNKLDGTYMMVSACHSYGPGDNNNGTANAKLADTLIGCGAEAVTTWYSESNLRHDVRVAQTIFGQLITGATLQDAVATARQWRGSTYSEMIEKRKYVEITESIMQKQEEAQKHREARDKYASHELHLTPENSDFRLTDGSLTRQQMIRAVLPQEEKLEGGYEFCFDYKGHACCEFIYYDFTWQEAEDFCESLGGHLLRLDKKDCEDFVNNSGYRNIYLNLWIDDLKENRSLWYGITPQSETPELKVLTDTNELSDSSGFICEWDTTWEQLLPGDGSAQMTPSSSPSAADPDDLTSEEDPSTKNNQTGRSNEQEVYASVVRDYESTHGKLTFNVASWNNRYYTGVFLIKLIDFDADGTRELLIGYATKNMYGDLSNPWMDVWTVKDGKPIKILDKATVQHGDIGSHCSYIKWNGKDCIVTGYDGGDIKLNVYACENGSFHSILTLKCEYTGADYRWILDGSEIGDEEGLTLCNRIRNEGIEYYGMFIDHSDISADTIQAELKEAYALLGL